MMVTLSIVCIPDQDQTAFCQLLESNIYDGNDAFNNA